MGSPQRIQRRFGEGWRMPADAVFVGRPSKWGNPFMVGGLIRTPGPWGAPPSPYDGRLSVGVYRDFTVTKVRDRVHATELFRDYIQFNDVGQWEPKMIRFMLGGLSLVCWCPLDQPCHADVLLEIANQVVPSG